LTARAILFDMDGTLVDSERLHYDSMSAVVTAAGGIMSDEIAAAITGLSGAECHSLLQRVAGFTSGFEEYVASKYRLYLKSVPSLLMRPGAAEVLAFLTSLSIPFAIVSNSDRILMDANLNAVGLQHPGLITVARNDVRNGKPAAEPYLRAAYLLGIDAADCIVVEDSVPGAIAGHAAGMDVVGWPEPHRHDIAFPEGTILADPLDLVATLASMLDVTRTNHLKDPVDVPR
jgi:HAD superfamily hydrolase (TIGR01509 family)